MRVVAATQKKPMTEKRSAAFEKALPPIAEKLETTLATSLNVALPAGAADDLLRKYAAEDGSLDREAFADVVKDAREAARQPSRRANDTPAGFRAVVAAEQVAESVIVGPEKARVLV